MKKECFPGMVSWPECNVLHEPEDPNRRGECMEVVFCKHLVIGVLNTNLLCLLGVPPLPPSFFLRHTCQAAPPLPNMAVGHGIWLPEKMQGSRCCNLKLQKKWTPQRLDMDQWDARDQRELNSSFLSLFSSLRCGSLCKPTTNFFRMRRLNTLHALPVIYLGKLLLSNGQCSIPAQHTASHLLLSLVLSPQFQYPWLALPKSVVDILILASCSAFWKI